jgi:hypothetical protein
MTKQQVICDRCGQEKKGANHWWQVYQAATAEKALVVQPSGLKPIGSEEWVLIVGDFCSQACAMRAIDEWMSKQIAESKAEEKLSQEAAKANA